MNGPMVVVAVSRVSERPVVIGRNATVRYFSGTYTHTTTAEVGEFIAWLEGDDFAAMPNRKAHSTQSLTEAIYAACRRADEADAAALRAGVTR